MKHTVIATLCVVIVFIYSLFQYFYISDFTQEMYGELINLEQNYNDETDFK